MIWEFLVGQKARISLRNLWPKPVMNTRGPSWWTFIAWPLVGAALAFSIVGAMTIGLFILPFATAALLALLKWGGNRQSSVGLISGIGLPLFYIAFLNRNGPGLICDSMSNGGRECMQEYSPWPFLIIGVGFVALGIALFMRLRTRGAAHESLES